MASGFIILRDGRCLSVGHSFHDAVLRSITEALGISSPLGAWLATQVPRDGDVDLGYAFVRTDGEQVSRALDTRGLTDANQRLFEIAARSAKPLQAPPAPVEGVARSLARLCEMLDACSQGRPPLEFSDWTIEAPPCKEKVGPGWIDSV